MRQKKNINNVLFIIVLVLGGLSFCNVLLGLGNKTLFWGLKNAKDNYIFYAIMLVISILIGIGTLKIIKKNHISRYIEYVSAYSFIILLFAHIILGEINSQKCLCFIVLSCIAAVIAYKLEKKGKIKHSPSFTWKNWKDLLPYCMLWYILIGIRIPIELYINNLGEFQFEFWYYALVLIIQSLIVSLGIYVASVFILNQRQVEITSTIMFAFSLLGYLQEMILNRSLDILNGEEQIWDKSTSIFNTIIWIIGIILIILVRIKYTRIKKIYLAICVYICLIQIATTVWLVCTGDTNNEAAFKAFTQEGSLELNDNNNVIVFVLDRCDISNYYEIIDEMPDFFDPLHDFTLYPNMTCEFANTYRAIPFLLTGTEMDADEMERYPVYAYENSDFLKLVHDSGYNIALYTEDQYVEEPYRENILNYDDDTKQKCRAIDTFNQLMRCSKYRIAPIKMKNMYQYGAANIDWLIDKSSNWTINNDYPFYCSLVENGLSISDKYTEKGTFYFYHFWGAHTPTNWSDEMVPVTSNSVSPNSQTRAAFKMLYEYINQMKKLNKYDDATIIITADHGKQLSEEYYLESGELDRTTVPILFVKYANQKQDEIEINEAPVSQGEIIPTILNAMDVDYTKYGRTLNEIGLYEERKRLFMSEIGLVFEIQGDSRQRENWKLIKWVK